MALPRTKGRVIMRTNYGDIDVELWPDQAPKAVRNFVQLCFEGYYDGCMFHRVISGFMMQGGDPTGTGKGGESIWGAPFEDEFHSRLRFNQRGMVAMANAGKNDNGSQFFITFDRCEWLNNKHTIFGTVAGDTFYNVQRMGELETDESDRPHFPPIIEKVEVIWNPFEDIVPRQLPKRGAKQGGDQEEGLADKSEGQPGVKNVSLLSFGGDEEESADEDDTPLLDPSRFKIRSSHDLDSSGTLSRDTGGLVSAASEEFKARKAQEKAAEEAKRAKLQRMRGAGADEGARSKAARKRAAARPKKEVHEKPADASDEEDGAPTVMVASTDFAEQMRQQILERQRRLAQMDDEGGSSDDSEAGRKREELQASILHFKSRQRAKKLAEEQEKKRPLSYLEEQRAKYLAKKKNYASREKHTLERLKEFTDKLRTVSKEGTDALKESGEDSSSDSSGSMSSMSSSSSSEEEGVDKSLPPWERESNRRKKNKKRRKNGKEEKKQQRKKDLDLRFLASHSLKFDEGLPSGRSEMPSDYTVVDPRGELGDEELKKVDEKLRGERKGWRLVPLSFIIFFTTVPLFDWLRHPARWEHASLEELSKPQKPMSELELQRKREEAYRQLQNPKNKRRWASPERRDSPRHKRSRHSPSSSSRRRSRSPRGDRHHRSREHHHHHHHHHHDRRRSEERHRSSSRR